jgi:hypothetical protein
LTATQWDALADDYDAIVGPEHQCLYSALCALPVLALFLSAFGGFKTVKNSSSASNYNWDADRWEDDDGNTSRVHPALFIGPPLFVLSAILLAVVSCKRNDKFLQDFEAFCARQTHPELTFRMSREYSTSHDPDGHSQTTTSYFWDISSKDDLEGAMQTVMQAMGGMAGGGTPFTSNMAGGAPFASSFATATGGGATYTSSATGGPDKSTTTNAASYTSYPTPATYPHSTSATTPTATTTPMATVMEPVIVVDATPARTSTTARQRLEELDRLQDLISKEEYQRKRKDILDSV